jgi:hypothetical protein
MWMPPSPRSTHQGVYSQLQALVNTFPLSLALSVQGLLNTPQLFSLLLLVLLRNPCSAIGMHHTKS